MALVIPVSMIGWLMGLNLESWKQGNRTGVLLNCSGVGYEIHLAPRHLSNLQQGNELSLWIHQVQRDDGSTLYGFPQKEERDLFRLLISVNGLGPQSGLALLQECRPHELVEAISNGDLRTLCRAQGIGKRTAERLAVDLRTPIAAYAGLEPEPSLVEGVPSERMPEVCGDVEATLMMLGYEELEIRRAIRAIADGTSGVPPDGSDQDAWLKSCLQWLSREAA